MSDDQWCQRMIAIGHVMGGIIRKMSTNFRCTGRECAMLKLNGVGYIVGTINLFLSDAVNKFIILPINLLINLLF